MRIIINNASTFKGGAEQVALSFITECKKFINNNYLVFINKNLASQLVINDFPGNFQFHIINKRPAISIKTFIKTMLEFKKLEASFNPDCVIATGGHGYWRPKAPMVSGYNMAHYIYPESPYFRLIPFRKRQKWKIKKIIDFYFYGRVDALIAQTEDVSSRLRAHFKNKLVFTVYNTVNTVFNEPDLSYKRLPASNPGEFRFLTVSANYPHKNIRIIRKVIDTLRGMNVNNIIFVLTLPEAVYQKSFEDDYKSQIYNVGPIPIKEVPALYNECDSMFLPTLLECFSASYAEAMFMEKPILTSDLGFAHTVCGDAAIYFNPLDEKDIAENIVNLFNNQALKKKLIEAGKKRILLFSTPESRASKFLDICQSTVNQNRIN